MMHEFLTNNRDDLTQRCKAKVALRPGRQATQEQLENGVPMFLDQLIRTLRMEQTDHPMDGLQISGPSGGGAVLSEVSSTAAQHGRQLLSLGFSVDQVVHDYGDLCQAITDLAHERDAPFEVDEFRTLNRCLDNAIADAVTEFSYQRDCDLAEKTSLDANEKLGFLVHELRNFLHTALLSFAAAKAGNMTLSGATGTVLERSLTRLGDMLDNTLSEVRLTDAPLPPEVFSLAAFILELKSAGNLAAEVRGCEFIAAEVSASLAVNGNRQLLFSAVWNLLQNAFKFTLPHSLVTLNAYAVADRILIDVKDHCGGLPDGSIQNMFRPFTQHGEDRTGLGLGLSIAQRCVESNGGTLTVKDVPGSGCIFTVNLPRFEIGV